MVELIELNNTLGLGGVETVVRRVSSAATSWGYEPRIVVPWNADVVDPPVPVQRLPKGAVRSFWSIRRILKAPGRRVIHAHHRRYATLSWMAWLTLRQRDRKRTVVIEHVHNMFYRQRLLSFRAPVLLAVGSGVEEMLLKRYGRPASRVIRVSNSADDAVPVTSHPGRETTIVGIGRMVPEKNPLEWLSLCQELIESDNAVTSAVWFGDGPLMPDMQRGRTHPAVRLAGNVANVQREIRALINPIVVSLSYREALPLAMLEALATGTPVVARNVGSVADAVVDGVSGVLLPSGSDAEAAKAALISLASDRVKLQDLRQSSRVYFQRNFSHEAVFKRLRKILADSSPP